MMCGLLYCGAAAAAGSKPTDVTNSPGLHTGQHDGRMVMGPVWDAAKAMGICCGFPVEGT